MSAIVTVLKPREKDIGEISVRRALPYGAQRSIGPWVFFDHFGPVSFKPINKALVYIRQWQKQQELTQKTSKSIFVILVWWLYFKLEY